MSFILWKKKKNQQFFVAENLLYPTVLLWPLHIYYIFSKNK